MLDNENKDKGRRELGRKGRRRRRRKEGKRETKEKTKVEWDEGRQMKRMKTKGRRK